MILFLSWIIPWIRTSGWLERDEARRHRSEPGIVLGLRGPKAGQLGAEQSRGWYLLDIFVDDVVAVGGVRSDGRPRWVAAAPGLHRVQVVPTGGDDRGSVGVDVHVPQSGRPAIVAVWPEYKRFADLRPARVEVVSEGASQNARP